MWDKQRKGHSAKFMGWFEREYMLVWLTVPSRRSVPEHQKCCTYQAANRIRQQVTPTGMVTRKVKLMPLFQYTYQQRASNCNNQPARTLQSADQSDTTGKNGEDRAMKELIQRCWEQIDDSRLRSSKKQIQFHSHHQKRSRDSQVIR